MSDTEERPQESKLRARMTNARLVVSRAIKHIAVYPAAQATPLVKDMKTALCGLIEEIERR